MLSKFNSSHEPALKPKAKETAMGDSDHKKINDTNLEEGLYRDELYELKFADCLDAIQWMNNYFDYHHECHIPKDQYQSEDLLASEFFELADLNHLKLSTLLPQCLNTEFEETLESRLPLLLIDKNTTFHILISKTPGHWQSYNLQQRCEQYLSTDELKALEALDILQCEFDAETNTNNIHANDAQDQHWLFQELFKHKKIYRDALLASIVINLVAIFIPLYSMNVYDKVVPNLAFNTLWVLSSIVIIGLIFDWILKQARAMLTDRVGQEIDRVLSHKILKRVMLSQSEFTPNSIGSFSKSFQDFDGVRDFLNAVTITSLVDLPFTLFFILIIYVIAGPLVIAPIAIMSIMLMLTLISQPQVKRQVKDLSALRNERSALSFEILQTLDTLKLNNSKQWMLNRWDKQVKECADISYQTNKLNSRINFTSQLCQQSMTIIVVVSGVYMISSGNLTMGGLIATMMLCGRASGSMVQITTLITRYESAKEGIASINQLLSMPSERPLHEIQIERKNFHGEIVFDRVSFQYPNTEVFALKDISLTIKPGERVALIGGIGSGKTTFINLVKSLYLPTDGRLLYDNLDAKFWDVDVLRQQIASVEQHPQLFKETIFKNITIGNFKSISDHQLNHALDQSGLSHILPKIEGGLEKSLGESNQGISGGQAQSIALARAFIKRSKLLLLDEPTSMMDKNSEQHILNTLKALPRSCTLMLSTHNLNLLSAVDRVIILEKGSIKYDGPVDSLRKKH